MNIIKLIICIILTFFTNSLFGQKNFLPGYIQTLSKDSVSGFINYQNWDKNPESIAFKKSLSDEETSYTPSEIKSFGVKDEIYVASIVEIETSSSNISTLDFEPEIQIKIDRVFLQTIIEGRKGLYYYKTKFGKENFYIKEGDRYNLLISKKYLKNIDGKTVEVENKRYAGQLIIYLSDCESISSLTQNIIYTHRSLEKLFRSYYNCTNSETSFDKKREKIIPEYGVLAGVSHTSVKITTTDGLNLFDNLSNAEFPNSIDPTIGGFINLYLARNRRRLSINNELIITNYHIETVFDDIISPSFSKLSSYEMGFTHFRLNNMFRYHIYSENHTLFFNLGISNGIAFLQRNTRITETTKNTAVEVIESKTIESVRKYEQAYNIGFGFRKSNYSAEARFERGTGVSGLLALGTPTTRVYLLFAYSF